MSEPTGSSAARQESERAFYRDLFEAAPDPYIVTDLDGVVRRSNRAATELLGIRAGAPLVLAIAAADRATFHTFLNAHQASGGRQTFSVASVSGDLVMQVSCSPLDSSQMLWLLRDVSSLIEARARLAELAERDRTLAEQLRQLDEIRGAFLLAVSHDLRTPLAAIAGLVDVLRRNTKLSDEERRRVLDQMGETANHVLGLLADLLDLERLESRAVLVQRADIEVGDLVAQVLARVDTGDRTLEASCTTLRARLDPMLVERITENLVHNAVEHTPSDAHVWIRCDREPDGILLVVEDDGPGIPADRRARVFELFDRDRGSARGGGLGVGLTLVRRFAELHGGYARVSDRPGGGARFSVLLTER